jgi:hypothetical protein
MVRKPFRATADAHPCGSVGDRSALRRPGSEAAAHGPVTWPWVGAAARDELGPRGKFRYTSIYILHEVTKCATKKSVFFSKIKKIGIFACFLAQT